MPSIPLPRQVGPIADVFGLVNEILELANIIAQFHHPPSAAQDRLSHILGIAQEIHDEVGSMRSTWTQTLSDAHEVESVWMPALLTQIQAVRTNVDTNLPVPLPPAPPSATAIKDAVWDELIALRLNANNQPVVQAPARGVLSIIGMLTNSFSQLGSYPLFFAPDFITSDLRGASVPGAIYQVAGVNVRARGPAQSVGDYLNAVTSLGWYQIGGLWVADIPTDNGSGIVLTCLVTDRAQPYDPRIDELLARTLDTAAADDKILAADFSAGSYQDELDLLISRTIQTAAADQKIMDTDFCECPPGLESSETFTIEGAGVVTIDSGSAGCTVDFTELPASVAAFGTAEPMRFRWLGEVAAGLGSRLYKTHYLDYSLNIITDWPADVDSIRYQLAPGAEATLTILRPPEE